MAMPGDVEKFLQYKSESAAKRDTERQSADGWHVEEARPLRVARRRGVFSRLFHRSGPVAVHYVRTEWPADEI